MKKLLSILASLAVAGSSASTVVACGENFGFNNGNNSNNNGYNPHYIPDGGSSNDDPIINSGGKNSIKPSDNSGSDSKHSGSNNGNNSNYNKVKAEDEAIVKANAEKFAKNMILQDQFGINGNYLNQELYGDENTKLSKDKPTVNGLKTDGTYGASNFPLMDWLKQAGVLDDGTYNTLVGTVLPMLLGPKGDGNGGIEMPNPSELGATLQFALPLLPALKGTISGVLDKKVDIEDKDGNVTGQQTQKDAIEQAVKGILTPQIGNLVTGVLKAGKGIDSKYDKLTVGDSMKSFLIAAAYIVGKEVGSDDYKDYADLTKVDNLDKAIDSLIKSISTIIAEKDKFQFDINKISDSESTSIITDALKMLSLYIEQFDAYKTDKGQDANHVFGDPTNPGKVLGTKEVIDKVRATKIGDVSGYQFNILKLISEVSWYLGKLDQSDGMYRLQAFIAMFIVDSQDRTSANKIMLNWDKNINNVSGLNQANAGEASEMSPVMKFVNKFLVDFMSANKPDGYDDTVKKIPVIGSKLKWDAIVEIARHNIYMILQSIAWNKGFAMSEGKFLDLIPMSVVDKGFSELPWTLQALRLYMNFPGLNVLPQWSHLEDKGILNYLFTGNVYELLNEFGTNKDMLSFYKDLSKDIMPHKDPDKDGKGGKQSASEAIPAAVKDITAKMQPFSTATILGQHIDLTDTVGNYEKVEFKTSNGTSILNTNLDKSVPKSGNWINYGKTYNDPYPEPSITKVVAGNYDGSSDTTKVYIYAHNIYNGNRHYPKDFGSTIKINGQAVNATTGSFDNSNYNVDVTYTATYKGKVTENMKVTGDAWDCTGYDNSGFWGAKKWWYDHKTIENDVINVPWENDTADISGLLKFDFSSDGWRNFKSLDLDNDQLKQYPNLTITGYKKADDKDGIDLIKEKKFNNSYSLNIQSVASWTLSSLLGTLGLSQFNRADGPLGLPVADNNSVGSLILKIGDLINENVPEGGTLDDINNALDLDRVQYLVNVIFGLDANGQDTKQGNIVSRLLDALDEGNVAKIQNVLGMKSTNTYSVNGLLGALVAIFTPSLQVASNGIVMGDTEAATPVWDYLLGTIKSAWSLANNKDNKKTIDDMNKADNYVFDWDNATEDKDNGQITLNINYSWAYVKFENNDAIQVPVTGTYKLVISNIKKGELQDYIITKLNN